ncbi:MAG TPA: shikimate dehydrogenase, partial [Chitinophagaceae bacterium]|nr:shikimate dehydrogenase [Chitinophagaceae bacterium]
YENFPIVAIEKLKTVLEQNPTLKGLNVTIPYKEQVVPFLYESNQIVKEIKACNCLKFIDGKLFGYNTDVTAFEFSLKKQLQAHHKKALVLGTGGAAKATGFVLKKLNIEYLNVSRKSSAESLNYAQITPAIFSEYNLIINTTPLGMYPNIGQAPAIPYELITPEHFLFDLIYNPEKTLFLQRGAEKGAMIKNGYEMLVMQAEESWRIWNQ